MEIHNWIKDTDWGRDESIERTEQTTRGYSFWLKGIQQEICVVLSVNPHNKEFKFHLSHFIKTPLQFQAYSTVTTSYKDGRDALETAMSSVTQEYKNAVEQNFTPCDTWLISNEDMPFFIDY